MNLTNYQKGFLSLLLAGLIYGSFGLLTRQLAIMFGDFTQVLVRQLIITLIAFLVLLWRGEKFWISNEKRLLVIIFGLISFVNALTFTISANLIKVSNTVFFVNTGSLIGSLILGMLVFKEGFSIAKGLLLSLCLAGLVIFTYPIQLDASLLGILLGLAAGLTDALSNSLKKYLKNISRMVLLFNQFVVSMGFGLLILPLTQETIIKGVSASSIIFALIFGLALLVVGNATIYGFQNFDLNLGSIVLASELIFSLIISAIFLGEFPTVNEIIGGILIMTAIVLINIRIDKAWFRLGKRTNS
ncbi:MAG: DMT family transporter [Candidatus Doudnabacteria bacterium]|nr:DMT family transporter [Candidatus Doudnabacteria bacterium]